MRSYRVSDANSYVVVTGAGIEDVRIVKKAFVMPFQRANVISISPFDFEITLQAMTIEKLNFSLPAVFTIGPVRGVSLWPELANFIRTTTQSR